MEVGKTQSIDMQLQVGGIEQEITVTAESPIVDTTSKQLGGSVHVAGTERHSVAQPQLHLVPRPAAGHHGEISTDSFGADSIRVNGQATQNANYTLDGAGNNDNFNNGNGGAQARTPVEAVQEFQLLTSQFDAEFGATSGGVVNAVSKQGTNEFHGTAFFFKQNQTMTSLDYFASGGPGQAGGAAEAVGRQRRRADHQNKLHYFVNLERIDRTARAR